jgi:hypothetical protein
MDETRQWAWAEDKDSVETDEFHGPYGTREAAIADALLWVKNETDPRTIASPVLGYCKFGDPLKHMPDAATLLENMNDSAHDDEFCFHDDAVFTATEEQLTVLDLLLQKWAEDLPRSAAWNFEYVEDIVVPT